MSVMSKLDTVQVDFAVLSYFIGQVAMPKYNRDQLEKSLGNLRDSLHDLGIVVEPVTTLPGLK